MEKDRDQRIDNKGQWSLNQIERLWEREEDSSLAQTSRREFLAVMTALAATSVVAGCDWLKSKSTATAQSSKALAGKRTVRSATAKSRVAVVRHSGVVKPDFNVDTQIVQTLVDKAVCLATGEKKRATAWKSLVTPRDIVGIKVNCIAGGSCCTRPEVVGAIIAGVLEAGVATENIVVWDRTTHELVNCGYRLNQNRGAVRCYSTEQVGVDEEIQVGPHRTRLSKILTQQVTALINVPIMKTHGGAGVTLALKNHYGSNNNPGDFHGDSCRDAAHLNTAEAIRTKTRICICDALRPLHDGGPGDNPQCRWIYGGIVASTDPVAHDAVCTDILLAKRREVNPSNYAIPQGPKHVPLAAELGLGIADLNQIDRTELELA